MATQISALNVKNHALQFLDYGKLIQGGYHANFCMKTQKLKLVKKPMIIKNERQRATSGIKLCAVSVACALKIAHRLCYVVVFFFIFCVVGVFFLD